MISYNPKVQPIGFEPIPIISKTIALPIKLGLVAFAPAPTSVSTTLLRLSTHCEYWFLYQLKISYVIKMNF